MIGNRKEGGGKISYRSQKVPGGAKKGKKTPGTAAQVGSGTCPTDGDLLKWEYSGTLSWKEEKGTTIKCDYF